jgi:hypothetical protein
MQKVETEQQLKDGCPFDFAERGVVKSKKEKKINVIVKRKIMSL